MSVTNDKELWDELGKRIAQARKDCGLTQEDLEAETGIQRAYIGFIEQGHRRPTVTTLFKLGKGLHISLEDLFKGL